MLHKTAILIFAKETSDEVLDKRLAGNNRENNYRILYNLNNRTYKLAQSTGLPIFISNQMSLSFGGSFGENLTLAIQFVFNRGFEKVICIGNDCPALEVNHLLCAGQCLATSEAVLGRDNRGGAYLIGVSKKSFDQCSFQNLPWQSEILFTAFSAIYDFVEVDVLEVLHDINTRADLLQYRRDIPFINWLLRFVLSKLTIVISFFNAIIIQKQVLIRKFRGPPVLIAKF